MEEILVSISCIAYNHEEYIADAIESFLKQKVNFKYEILIHDDASTDNTGDIIRAYQKKYPDIIKPIIQKENQLSKGIAEINYQFNFLRAKGKYIALCEGDDYWIDSCKLMKQIEYMQNHIDCSMCFHATNIVKVGKSKLKVIRPYTKSCISPTEDIILGGGGFMATNSILFRKTIIDDISNFYYNAPVGDYPLQIIASTKNYAYYINEIMSVYRTGVTGSWSSKMMLKENKFERFKIHTNKIKIMLMEFDDYTKKKYHNAIQKKIIKDEFILLVENRNIKEIKKLKYQVIFKTLTGKEKVKIFARFFFPKIYEKLRSIKQTI